MQLMLHSLQTFLKLLSSGLRLARLVKSCCHAASSTFNPNAVSLSGPNPAWELCSAVVRLTCAPPRRNLSCSRARFTKTIICLQVCLCCCTYMVIKFLSCGNGRCAELNFPFRETFAVSLMGHLRTYIFHNIKDHAYNSLSPGHGPRLMLEAFSFVATIAELSRNFARNFLKTDILTTCVTQNFCEN